MRLEPWTDDRVAELVRLRGQGLTCAAIAEAMGLTRSSVIGKLYRMGEAGSVKPAKLARRGRMDDPARPAPSFWTPEREQELRALHAEGLTCHQIGQRFSRDATTIHQRLRRMGLSARVGLPKAQASLERRARPGRVPDAPAPTTGGVPFIDLAAHHCRAPLGAPHEVARLFCGAPVARPGGSWCAYHHNRFLIRPGSAEVAA